VSSTAAQAATSYTGVFSGRPDQVARARHAITRHLAGHPGAADAALIISELAANADAPRGALLYPRCSREELKGGSWA
jgi:hypothetical protein